MAYVPTFSGLVSDDPEDEKRRLQGQEAGPDSGAGGGAVGAAPAGAAPSYTQSNFASGKKILEKAQNEPLNFSLGDEYGKKIDQASTDLSKSSADWNSSYENAMNANRFSDSDLEGGISGADQGRLKGFLGADYSGGNSNLNVQPFMAPSSPYSSGSIASLGSSAGLQGEISRAQRTGGNYGYTQGQSALDSLLYGSRPETRAQIRSLGEKSQQYTAAKSKAEEDAKAKLSGAAGQLSSEQQRIRDALSGQATGISQSAVANRESRIQPGDYTEGKRYADDVYKQMRENITDKADRRQFDEWYDKTINKNIGRYYDRNVPESIYSKDEARRFNNIMSLLGRGESVTEGGGSQTLNKRAVERDLNNRLGIYTRKQSSRDKEAAKQAEADRQAARAAEDKKERESKRGIEVLKSGAQKWDDHKKSNAFGIPGVSYEDVYTTGMNKFTPGMRGNYGESIARSLPGGKNLPDLSRYTNQGEQIAAAQRAAAGAKKIFTGNEDDEGSDQWGSSGHKYF